MKKPAESVDVRATLQSIYKTERTMQDLSGRIVSVPYARLMTELEQEVKAAEGHADEREGALRLVCLARLLRGVPGPKSLDLLVDILGSEFDEARSSAGIAIEDTAYEHPEEVRRAVERAIKRLPEGNAALCELPFVVLNIADDAVAWLSPLLTHKDPEAVAATAEALVEWADPAAIKFLEPLREDKRTVTIDDESTDEVTEYAVGEIVSDAIQALQEVEKAVSQGQGK